MVSFSVFALTSYAEDPLGVVGCWLGAALGLAAAIGGVNMMTVALGPIKPTEARFNRRFRIALVVVAVVVVSGLVGWQHSLYEADMRAIYTVSNWHERQTEKAKAAEKNLEALQQDISNYDLELERISPRIPQEMELERFVESLARWSEEYGMQVISQSNKYFPGERYDHCVISLELKGEEATLRDLEEWPGKLRRTSGHSAKHD